LEIVSEKSRNKLIFDERKVKNKSLSKRREGGKNGKVGNWAGFRVRISDTLTLTLTLALP